MDSLFFGIGASSFGHLAESKLGVMKLEGQSQSESRVTIAQSVICLPYEYSDLSSSPGTNIRKWNTEVCACDLRARKQQTGGP